MPITSRYTRLRNTFLGYIFFFLFLSVNLIYVQLIKYPFLSDLAKRQHNLVIKLEPIRGTIYDCNMRPLAFSINLDSIYANPRMIKDPLKAATLLSEALSVDRLYLVKKFTKDKAFVWVKRKVSPQVAAKVKALGLDYIGFIKEPKRFYPNEKLACHVVGFAGLDNVGLEGIEAVCDQYLKGKPGWYFTKQDAKQRGLPSYKNKRIPPVDGYNVVLTIDSVLQNIVEMQLDVIMQKFHSKAATIIVMEPSTGRILALANRPNYLPNQFQDFQPLARKNRAITDIFEPGSVFKMVTASAALGEGKVSFSDKFFCENGSYKPIPSYTLHDYHPYGWLTFRQVIEKSSNIGVGKVARIVGPQDLYRYIKAYGFGEKTGIELAGEVSGIIRPPSQWSKTSPWNIPIGQEVAITSIQALAAVSAIANNGVLMKPYIIDRIQNNKGQVLVSFSNVPVRRVLAEKTARQMQDILAGVVENGTGTAAKIPGYRSAGKTGTAQKVESNGRYSNDKYVGTFVGFAPAENAALACIVTVDEPQPVHFGAVVAAPAFSKVVGQGIEYLKTKSVMSAVASNSGSQNRGSM
jgi:cell division protein FtsI (penicillin-binding protein 3)